MSAKPFFIVSSGRSGTASAFTIMAAAGGLAAVELIPVVTTFAVFCLRPHRAGAALHRLFGAQCEDCGLASGPRRGAGRRRGRQSFGEDASGADRVCRTQRSLRAGGIETAEAAERYHREEREIDGVLCVAARAGLAAVEIETQR